MNTAIQNELNSLKVAVSRLKKKISEIENRISVIEQLAQKGNEMTAKTGVDAEMEMRVRIAVEKSKKRRGLKY